MQITKTLICPLLITIFTGCSKFDKNPHRPNFPPDTVDWQIDRDIEFSKFSPLPDTMSLQVEVNHRHDTLNGKKKLLMDLYIINSLQDSLAMTFASSGSRQIVAEGGYTMDLPGVYYDFIIADKDSSLIWRRLLKLKQTDSLSIIKVGSIGAPKTFFLAPGDTIHFDTDWDYKDIDGNKVKEEKYLLYCIMEEWKYGKKGTSLHDKHSMEYSIMGMDTLVIDK